MFLISVTTVLDLSITIENIVIIGAFSENINLVEANQKLENSKRNWKKFPGLAYKLKNPPASFLLFNNGKFVCTGIKTKNKGQQAITTLLNLLKTKELVSKGCGVEWGVKNLVASVAMGGASVSLETFTREFESIYEPDRFPAAVYKPDDAKATFLVFLSGKLICSGIADEETLKNTVKKFCQQLEEKNTLQTTITIPNAD